MLYSVAGGQWTPWAAEHLIRFGFWFAASMIALAMVDLQVWFVIAYPLYAVSLGLLVMVAAHGHVGAGRAALDQPRPDPPVPAVGAHEDRRCVLALARFYHGLSRQGRQALLLAADPRRR